MRMGVTDEEARGLLGRLNLGGDSGDKPVEAFSGGERRRIMLARLMAQRADKVNRVQETGADTLCARDGTRGNDQLDGGAGGATGVDPRPG